MLKQQIRQIEEKNNFFMSWCIQLNIVEDNLLYNTQMNRDSIKEKHPPKGCFSYIGKKILC